VHSEHGREAGQEPLIARSAAATEEWWKIGGRSPLLAMQELAPSSDSSSWSGPVWGVVVWGVFKQRGPALIWTRARVERHSQVSV
jgi:hypothetical protein